MGMLHNFADSEPRGLKNQFLHSVGGHIYAQGDGKNLHVKIPRVPCRHLIDFGQEAALLLLPSRLVLELKASCDKEDNIRWQKVRIKWMEHGDRNRSFYQVIANKKSHWT